MQSNISHACVFMLAVVTCAVNAKAANTGRASAEQHPRNAGNILIWDNGPATSQATSSQIDTVYPFDSQVADDFRLIDQNPGTLGDLGITRIEWTGAYFNGVPGNPNTGFNLFLYADEFGRPTGGPGDPTNTALESRFIPIEDANETPLGDDRFSYEATQFAPFVVDVETTYWLAIQAVAFFPPQWGWSWSSELHGTQAQFGFPLQGFDYWTPVNAGDGIVHDQSFRMWVFPEPSSLSLLLFGCASLTWRRR